MKIRKRLVSNSSSSSFIIKVIPSDNFEEETEILINSIKPEEEKKCNHEFIPLFTSISCKYCGMERKD